MSIIWSVAPLEEKAGCSNNIDDRYWHLYIGLGLKLLFSGDVLWFQLYSFWIDIILLCIHYILMASENFPNFESGAPEISTICGARLLLTNLTGQPNDFGS